MPSNELTQLIQTMTPDTAAFIGKFILALIAGNIALIGSAASFLLKNFVDFKVLSNRVATLEVLEKRLNDDLNAAHSKIRELEKRCSAGDG